MSLLGSCFYIDDLIKHKGANGLKYPSVTEINDVVYDENQAEVCKLDLLFDESKLGKNGKYPVVFNIHGGGWITGDKRFRRGVCIQYAFDPEPRTQSLLHRGADSAAPGFSGG